MSYSDDSFGVLLLPVAKKEKIEVGNVFTQLAILTDDVGAAAAQIGAVESDGAAGAVRMATGKDPDGYGVTLLEYADYAKELSV